MAATGSVLVYRHELDKALAPVIIMVRPVGQRLSNAQLAVAARAARPVAPALLPSQALGDS